MKKNTNEYLGALNILKIKELPARLAYNIMIIIGTTILFTGIVLFFFAKDNTLPPNSGIIVTIVGCVITFIISPPSSKKQNTQ